jgi:hypothetical protein
MSTDSYTEILVWRAFAIVWGLASGSVVIVLRDGTQGFDVLNVA